MRQGLSDFQSMLAHSRRGIVYYAGHGVKVGDHSILVPVDLGEVSAARLTQVGLKLRQLVTTLAPAQPEALAIILDACRDNPLAAAQIRKKGLGEAGIDIPSGFLFIYGPAPARPRWTRRTPVPTGYSPRASRTGSPTHRSACVR